MSIAAQVLGAAVIALATALANRLIDSYVNPGSHSRVMWQPSVNP